MTARGEHSRGNGDGLTENRFVTIIGDGSPRKISMEREYPVPVERLWEMVTYPENLKHWWLDWQAGGEIQNREGGNIRLGDGSWINGRITSWNPPHIFAFTWNDHLHDPENTAWYEHRTGSQLRIDLVSVGKNETLLNLVQFMPADHAAGGAAGWHHFGENLADYLEKGEVMLRPERFEQLKAHYNIQMRTIEP